MKKLFEWTVYLVLLTLLISLLHTFYLMFSKPETSPVSKPNVPIRPIQPRRISPTTRETSLPEAPDIVDTNAPSNTTTNAANLYRQAFALYDALSKEEKDVLAEWKKEVDPAKAAELLQKIQPILDLLKEAAVTGKCDWGLGAMYQLEPAVNLSCVALWGAARTFASDPNAASDIVASQLKLGNNVGNSADTAAMVNSEMQLRVIELVCANASLLNTSVSDKLVSSLIAADYDESFYRALEADAETTSAQFANDIESGEQSLPDCPEFANITNLTPQQVAVLIRQAGDLDKAYLQSLQSPGSDTTSVSNQIVAAASTNPFARTPYVGALNQAQYSAVQRAMMAAGLSYRREGQSALAKFPDPSTGQPFTFQQTTNGFTLRSSFSYCGDSVTMTFPR